MGPMGERWGGRGLCRRGWAAGNLRAEAGQRAKGTAVQIWCHPGALAGPERRRQAGVRVLVREERAEEGGGRSREGGGEGFAAVKAAGNR